MIDPRLAMAGTPSLEQSLSQLHSAEQGSGSFAAKLADAADTVSAAQHGADQMVAGVASGKDTDLHAMMIALEEADIAMRTLVSVRDKAVESYQQLMNMAI